MNELTAQKNKKVEQESPLPKLLAIGDKLFRALEAARDGIGCGCGGDYGLCGRCSKADAEAKKSIKQWKAVKKGL